LSQTTATHYLTQHQSLYVEILHQLTPINGSTENNQQRYNTQHNKYGMQ